MAFILLLIAAIALIVLAPFQGAVTLGIITLGVIVIVWIVMTLLTKAAWRRMNEQHDQFWDRHRRF